MRVIQVAKDGALELRWMWLPTFIGQNHMLQKELGKAWKERFPNGVAHDEDSLDMVHSFTINWFCQQIPLEGLGDYLRALEHVKEE